MAMSTCVKCGGMLFETKEASPANSSYKVIFVQCSSCGGVVGALDYYNIGTLLHKLAKALGVNI